jgi:sugar lactone lactonase YvrE
MFAVFHRLKGPRSIALLALAAVVLATPSASFGKNKKPAAAPAVAEKPKPNLMQALDTSKIVWPPAPDPTRIKYLDYFSNEKFHPEDPKAPAKKTSWMNRMAGGDIKQEQHVQKSLFALANPNGMVVDHAGNLYVADGKVSAVFIFNTETKDLQLIKTSSTCRFGYIVGLAIDDDDTLYISDSDLRRVDVFDGKHQFQGTFKEGMVGPGGLALDPENRLLYVVDTQADQVLVYDADTRKLLRRIGTGGKQHTLTTPGDFSKPTNAAVDKDGNLYVTDSWNDRVEIFDADGNFIRTFGKNGDGPGRFARPKGIGVDADGHIWVADAVQDSVQIFTDEGDLLLYIGGHGLLPGQFSSLAGLTIDSKNRVFTSEQYPGRVQMFRYFTESEAKAEVEHRKTEDAAKKGKGAAVKPATATTTGKTPEAAQPPPAATSPAPAAAAQPSAKPAKP